MDSSQYCVSIHGSEMDTLVSVVLGKENVYDPVFVIFKL